MSGVFKSVGKVFKKVTNVVKKVAPVALAAGALIFTAGSAMGATGGWGQVAQSMGSTLGGQGTLGRVLGGALQYAGYGALAGGAMSWIGGGDPIEGAGYGALAGGIGGGLMGGLSNPAAAAGGMGGSALTAAPSATGSGIGPLRTAGMGPEPLPQFAGGNSVSVGPLGTRGTFGPTATGAAASGGGGLLSRITQPGGWLERNQGLVGPVVSGIGGALMSGGEDDAAIRMSQMDNDAAMARQTQQQGYVSANYDTGAPLAPGQMAATPTGGQRPADRFDAAYFQSWDYRFNPDSGQVERVPRQAQA